MDFEKAVAAFTRKKKGQNLADDKREAYRKVVKEYTEMKYAPAVGGVRKEMPITQERIEKRAQEKKETSIEVADDLAAFFDIDLDMGAAGDLEIGKAKA